MGNDDILKLIRAFFFLGIKIGVNLDRDSHSIIGQLIADDAPEWYNIVDEAYFDEAKQAIITMFPEHLRKGAKDILYADNLEDNIISPISSTKGGKLCNENGKIIFESNIDYKE